MTWVLLSLLAGLADAVRDSISKKASTTTPRALVTWSYSLCALPFFLPGMVRNIPADLPLEFWALLVFVSSCHVGGGLALVKALQISDLSLCIPMMAFTPVFLLVVGPALTGDAPTFSAIVGAVLVTCGSYVLNLGKARDGIIAPIRALLSERGARIMLGLALLWSITGSIDRIAMRHYDLSFWASAQLSMIAILLLPFVLRAGVLKVKSLKEAATHMLSLGTANALSLGAYLIALQTAPVHYVVCLKRSNILFAVVLGRLFFAEKAVAARLPGALLMLLGVILISLSR
jgi:drug/metabolite transporter (DMT)-like permease